MNLPTNNSENLAENVKPRFSSFSSKDRQILYWNVSARLSERNRKILIHTLYAEKSFDELINSDQEREKMEEYMREPLTVQDLKYLKERVRALLLLDLTNLDQTPYSEADRLRSIAFGILFGSETPTLRAIETVREQTQDSINNN